VGFQQAANRTNSPEPDRKRSSYLWLSVWAPLYMRRVIGSSGRRVIGKPAWPENLPAELLLHLTAVVESQRAGSCYNEQPLPAGRSLTLLRSCCGLRFIGRFGRVLFRRRPVFIMAINPFEPGRHSSERNGCPPHFISCDAGYLRLFASRNSERSGSEAALL